MKHKTATVAATEPQDWRAAAAARRAQLAAQEARLRADEVRYVKAGILRPEEARFGAADLFRSPRVSARVRSRESRPAPSRKRSLARASSRSADSGDDGPSDDPPPRRRKLCGFCGGEIPADRGPRSEYCTEKHAANARQRRKRQRDRERRKRQPVVKPRKPRVPPDWVRMTTPPDPVELARLQGLVICGCNGRHQEFDPGQCHRCGHRLPRGAA